MTALVDGPPFSRALPVTPTGGDPAVLHRIDRVTRPDPAVVDRLAVWARTRLVANFA